MSKKSLGPGAELSIIRDALNVAITLGGYIQDIAGNVPEAYAALNTCVLALMDRKRELQNQLDREEMSDSVRVAVKSGAHAIYG